MRAKDLSGERFGRLVVVERDPIFVGKKAKWICLCDCGKQKSISRNSLVRGLTKSCGCLNIEMLKKRDRSVSPKGNFKHGYARTGSHKNRKRPSATYNAWCCMKTRCTNKNHDKYHLYGGRGIGYCKEWESFENFVADMGEKPDGCSLDRIDNYKGYSKDNCRWATREQQSANRRKPLVSMEYEGEMIPLVELAKKLNVDYKVLHNRLTRQKRRTPMLPSSDA